jgi:hypothetical protein
VLYRGTKTRDRPAGIMVLIADLFFVAGLTRDEA